LKKLRKEFNYWYPVDLRVSGKDLIQNHLTFSIYSHCAIFPEDKWPKAIRANGHLLLNSEKMSKSTGNFFTLSDAVKRFSADGVRFALADAGDMTDDANFLGDTADNAVLRLHSQLQWIKETLSMKDTFRSGPIEIFADRVFQSELNNAIIETDKNYCKMLYREALKTGFYDLQTARDNYRLSVQVEGMHKDLILRFIEVQALLLSPFTPHCSEHIWEMLGYQTSIMNARWPNYQPVDTILLRANTYLQDTIKVFRQRLLFLFNQAKKSKKEQIFNPKKINIYIATSFPEWQEVTLVMLREMYAKSNQFPPQDEIASQIKKIEKFQKMIPKIMSFVAAVRDDVKIRGSAAFELSMPFDETQVLRNNADFIRRSLELQQIFIYTSTDTNAPDPADKRDSAAPGKPSAVFS